MLFSQNYENRLSVERVNYASQGCVHVTLQAYLGSNFSGYIKLIANVIN